MTGEEPTPEELADRQATADAAAALAVAQVHASFALELAGRPLTAQQRTLQRRAEDLARHWTREERRRGRP